MACKRKLKQDKPYKFEADLKNVLQEFALKYILEQPDDLSDFGIIYFKDLKERGIVIKVDDYVEYEPDDEQEIFPSAPLRRRNTIYSGPTVIDEDPHDVYAKTPEERQNLYHRAQKVMLFKALDEDQIASVLDAMYEKPVKPGEIVIQEGEDGDYFYIIEYGIFEASVKDKNDVENVIKTYHHSGSFGELALMYNQPRSATITAKTEGRLWVMRRDSFRSIVLKGAFKKRQMYQELISKVPMLSVLKPNERIDLVDALTSKWYKDGEKIIKQGDSADGMYLIESGEVDITVNDEGGQEVLINSLGKGDYFGELALVSHQPRAATVRARGQVKLAFLDVDAFERLLGPCMAIIKRNLQLYEQQLQIIKKLAGNSPVAVRN